MKKLRGPKGSHVDISIARIGLEEEFEVTLVRDKIPIVSVLAHFMIDDNTGYVKVNRFARTTAVELKEALNNLEKNVQALNINKLPEQHSQKLKDLFSDIAIYI